VSGRLKLGAWVPRASIVEGVRAMISSKFFLRTKETIADLMPVRQQEILLENPEVHP
jgi:hypothetical protein